MKLVATLSKSAWRVARGARREARAFCFNRISLWSISQRKSLNLTNEWTALVREGPVLYTYSAFLFFVSCHVFYYSFKHEQFLELFKY